MKGYVFVYGVDGFGMDTAPAHEEGCYTNFEKAFAHLVELNHKIISSDDFTMYEDGYGEDYFPHYDKELSKAEKDEDWDLFDKLMEKHIITDEIEINKEFINCEFPYLNMYAIEEIEIIED